MQSMDQTIGVLIAIASSCLGGTAAAVTRYLVGNADPLTLAILRWGIGFLACCRSPCMLRAQAGRRAATGCASPGSASASSACSSSSTTSPSATRPRPAPASRCRPCRCRPWSSARSARHRTADRAQDRSASAIAMLGVLAALASGLASRAARRLARRIDHDRRRAMHGLLQRLVAPVHPALERARLSLRRHGSWRGGAGRSSAS